MQYFDIKILNILTQAPCNFEPGLIAEIEAAAVFLSFKNGQVVMDVGDVIKMLPIVTNGVFKISRINDDGQEVLLYYIREGESCSMSFTRCIMSQPSAIKATAEDGAALIYIPVNLSEEWMVKYLSWKRYVMATIFNQFTGVVKAFDEISSKKTDERLINYLKEKSRITGTKLINLSHQQIANEMGTNRVVISRLLKKLENENKLLLYRSQIKLLKGM